MMATIMQWNLYTREYTEINIMQENLSNKHTKYTNKYYLQLEHT